MFPRHIRTKFMATQYQETCITCEKALTYSNVEEGFCSPCLYGLIKGAGDITVVPMSRLIYALFSEGVFLGVAVYCEGSNGNSYSLSSAYVKTVLRRRHAQKQVGQEPRA